MRAIERAAALLSAQGTLVGSVHVDAIPGAVASALLLASIWNDAVLRWMTSAWTQTAYQYSARIRRITAAAHSRYPILSCNAAIARQIHANAMMIIRTKAANGVAHCVQTTV
jgi:hypothetical protein